VRTDRIILKAIRRADGRAEIQEWVHIDLIEEGSEAAAHHQTGRKLVSAAKSRREVFVVGRKDRIDTLSLDLEPAAFHEDSEVVCAIAMQRAEVLVAQAQVDVEFRSKLSGIGSEEIVPGHQNVAFRISDGNGRCADITRQKIGQSSGVLIAPRNRKIGAAERRPREAPGFSQAPTIWTLMPSGSLI
jgi:hypothetical protein